MTEKLSLRKFTLMATLRCTLRCELCSESVPMDKPGDDLSLDMAKDILTAFFYVIDHVEILHMSGGETFLHPTLPEIIEACMKYRSQFDRFMIFTNSTVPISEALLDTLKKHKDCVVVHASDYNLTPDITDDVLGKLEDAGINVRRLHYHGDNQDFGGWVDYGGFEFRNLSPEALAIQFSTCAITSNMRGNWRTRDGKLFWCTRVHRGYELGLIPTDGKDFVDILDASTTRDEKRKKFKKIANAKYIDACNYCSGDCGTEEANKRFSAAKQAKGGEQ